VFGDGDGADTVLDFSTGNSGWWWWHWSKADTIVLDVSDVETFDDVLDHATQVRGDVVFDFGNNDVLTLHNTRLAHLDNSNFDFV